MKLPKEIYNYVEFELYHYDMYREELSFERERILEGGYCQNFGESRGGSGISKPTENRACVLVEGTAVLGLQRIIRAIEAAVLTKEHQMVFHEYYQKKRKDTYSLCDDIGMTRSTFFRYKTDIIINTAKELGIIKAGIC